MIWASELAQTLPEPTEMTRKWKAILSFLYILIQLFLEGPRNQDKCQEQARSVSSFNGSVSNTAASAWGLVCTWESSVSATSHKDVATPELIALVTNPVFLLLQLSGPGRVFQELQGRSPRDQADCRQDSWTPGWGHSSSFSSISRPSGLPSRYFQA